ncbi:MAG: tetratricopeptide repeat protein [Bacteroidota bacterium]|nr:tetratricopeptide repeat protein [Bacteroidota bacterium]
MLRAKKKISKREIKEDKLVTSYFEARQWYDVNRKRVNMIAGIVVAAILLGWFYLNNVSANNEKAAVELAGIFSYYDNGNYQVAVNGMPEKNLTGFQSIADNYGGTKAGNMAKFYLADSYYNMQQYDKALEYFKECSGPTDFLEASRLAGVAACYDVKGDAKDAAEYYEKAAAKSPKGPNAADYYFNAAQNYAKSNNKDEALSLFKKIKEEYPSSDVARDIDRYIAEVTAS